jgi:uncharacterized protein (TIGR02147 family)
METQNVTELLKKEFIHRCQKNESYSLRAYARYLNVDHSLLAKILRGQKLLSKKMAYEVGGKLGLSSSKVQELFEVSKKVHESQMIQEDVFILISDWLHFALLELLKTEGFKYSPKAVARKLGITALEASAVFERLERLGFVDVQEDQSIKLKKPNNNWFNYQGTTEARKILQKELLAKSIEAVDQVEFGKRANSSLTIAIDPKDLPKLKKHIQHFIDETDAFSEKTPKKKEVYQLCVSLFPLTQDLTH